MLYFVTFADFLPHSLTAFTLDVCETGQNEISPWIKSQICERVSMIFLKKDIVIFRHFYLKMLHTDRL